MKPFKIEENFIILLTRCSWWLDKNFNIGTVLFSVLYIVFTVIFIKILVVYNLLDQAEDFKVTVIISLINIIIVIIYNLLLLRVSIYLTDIRIGYGSVLANTKISPNPNKIGFWLSACRYTCVLPLIFSLLGIFSFLPMVVMILTVCPSFYILCIDPLPPALKKKMLEEKGDRKLELLANL